MNILVTGAGGQLGREMQTVGKESPHRFFFTDICSGFDRLDITDPVAVRNYISANGIQAIVNCAAWTNVDGAEDPGNSAAVEALNAKSPENLALAMKESGGLLIHISTDYVFGAEQYNTPCREDRDCAPSGAYGLSKLHGEQAIRKVFDFHPDEDRPQSPTGAAANQGAYVIIRTAWLYSEFGRNFFKTMLDLTATRPEVKVVYDQTGTPTYALDLAKSVTVILEDYSRHLTAGSESPYAKSGIYHFSGEGVCSWFDFAKAIQAVASDTESVSPQEELRLTGLRRRECRVIPCRSSDFPSAAVRPAYSVLDKTKIKETFGVNVPYWTESLKECMENYSYICSPHAGQGTSPDACKGE